MGSRTPQTARIRGRLVSDHAAVERLWDDLMQALDAGDAPRALSAWSHFDGALVAHLDAEERYLIPPLLSARPRDAHAVLEEHKHLRARLAELRAAPNPDARGLTSARAFIDELRAHARHEDRLVYAWAEEHLDAADRASLAASLAADLHSGRAGKP